MMSKMKKWIACLIAALLVFRAVPAFMEDGEVYTSNVTMGTLAGFRDAMEIVSDSGSYLLAGGEVILRVNENYTPVWTSSDESVATVNTADATASITVTAITAGDADITAVDGNQTKVYRITVVNPEDYEEGEQTTPEDEGKQKMVIIVNGGTLMTHYTGEEQNYNEYSLSSNSSEFDPSRVSATRDITVTASDCGYYMMNLTEEDFHYSDETVNAVFVVNDGYMKISPAKATVKANEIVKDFGTEDPELTAEVEGVFGEDTIEYTLSRDEGEEIGTYLIKVEGEELQGNYRIQYQNGMMTIQEAEKVVEPLTVYISSSHSADEPVFFGDQITLTAVVTGAEEGEYTLQWQYSTDLQNWTDIPGANELTYTFSVDGETATYAWRAVAERIQ